VTAQLVPFLRQKPDERGMGLGYRAEQEKGALDLATGQGLEQAIHADR